MFVTGFLQGSGTGCYKGHKVSRFVRITTGIGLRLPGISEDFKVSVLNIEGRRLLGRV